MSNKKVASRKRSIAESIQTFLAPEGTEVVDSSLVDHLVACHEQFVENVASEIVTVASQRSAAFQVGVKDVSKAMNAMGLEDILEIAQKDQPAKTKRRKTAKKSNFTAADAEEQERLMEASKAKMMKNQSSQNSPDYLRR